MLFGFGFIWLLSTVGLFIVTKTKSAKDTSTIDRRLIFGRTHFRFYQWAIIMDTNHASDSVDIWYHFNMSHVGFGM